MPGPKTSSQEAIVSAPPKASNGVTAPAPPAKTAKTTKDTGASTGNAAALRLKTFLRGKIDGYSPASGKRRFIRSAVGGDERDEAAANKYSSLLRDVEVAVAPIESLERANREQHDEIQALYSQNRGLSETNRNYSVENARIKEQVQHLSDENPVLSDKIVELKEEIQSIMDRNRALTDENNRLTEGIENLKNESHRLIDEKQTLESDNTGMRTHLKMLITGIVSLHSAIPKGQTYV